MAFTLVNTIKNKWEDTKKLHVLSGIVFTGAYNTGGLAFDPLTSLVDTRPGFTNLQTGSQPNFVIITSVNGIQYCYDAVNKKIIIRSIAVTLPSVHIATGAPATNTGLGLTADTAAGALTKTSAGALDIPFATLFGGTITAAYAELAASALPAGVTGDIIVCYAIFPKN